MYIKQIKHKHSIVRATTGQTDKPTTTKQKCQHPTWATDPWKFCSFLRFIHHMRHDQTNFCMYSSF